MEEYIFIIIAIILSILGAFNRNKKKKIASMPDSESESAKPNSFFSHFLDEDTFNEFTEEPEPVYAPTPPPVPEKRVKKESTTKPFFNYESKIERIPEKSSKIKTVKGIQKSSIKRKVPLREAKDFSLKKAVIYSEILNRKY